MRQHACVQHITSIRLLARRKGRHCPGNPCRASFEHGGTRTRDQPKTNTMCSAEEASGAASGRPRVHHAPRQQGETHAMPSAQAVVFDNASQGPRGGIHGRIYLVFTGISEGIGHKSPCVCGLDLGFIASPATPLSLLIEIVGIASLCFLPFRNHHKGLEFDGAPDDPERGPNPGEGSILESEGCCDGTHGCQRQSPGRHAGPVGRRDSARFAPSMLRPLKRGQMRAVL
jgi:hypothetical protein